MNQIDLDPLLFYLHDRGHGGWPTFAAGVERYEDSLDPHLVGRFLSEHAAVEFDWDGSRSWSVTNAQIVKRTAAKDVRWSLWGGTFRSSRALALSGVRSQIELRHGYDRTGKRYCYRHAVALDPTAMIDYADAAATVDSKALLEVLPALRSILHECPMASPPPILEKYEATSPSFGHFVRAQFSTEQNKLWRVIREGYGRRRYFYCDGQNVRQVQGWLGFWLERSARWPLENSAIYRPSDTTFVLPGFPVLPILYTRAILLAGGIERDPSVSARRIRWFSNVPADVAKRISNLLGIKLEEET